MQQQLPTTTTMIIRPSRTTSALEASMAVGADVGVVVGSGLWAATVFGVGAGTDTGTGKAVVGGSVGLGSGTAVGEGAGTAVGEGDGESDGEGDGGVLGAGDGDDVGTGLGAGVGENVATTTESAVALAIDSRRAERSPGAASRRRAAADWIAVVRLPSLTAEPSVAITCECTLWSPLLSAYVLAMNASDTRTSLVRVTPVAPSVYGAHVASSNVAFERTASHASS